MRGLVLGVLQAGRVGASSLIKAFALFALGKCGHGLLGHLGANGCA